MRREKHPGRGFAPAAKAGFEREALIAAVNHCATQNRVRLVFYFCLSVALSTVSAGTLAAQDLHAPSAVTAGEGSMISTTGSGKATFYLVGPGVSIKSDVSLGNEISLRGQDLRDSGEYFAILCFESCRSASFYVTPAKPASLAFLVHPSRVPVAQSDAVSGVALAFDQFGNLVLDPGTINFQLTAGKTSLLSRAEAAHDGIAWFRTASGKSAGPLQVVASSGDISARRNVQEVASDACNLRITGQRTKDGLVVETEPVRDCAGNPVPDGTIVSFTATEASGKSTVDAPIKRGIARAEIAASGPVVVSVASGVAMGNELRIGGRQ
jgi:hypothetical protein